MNAELKEKFRTLRLLATDFDGVMTDGYVYVNQEGVETVRCSRKDGLGLGMIRKAGLLVVVISKESNPVVKARCRKLNIPCYQGIEDGEGKLDILKRFLAENSIHPTESAYIGDDLNDRAAMQYVHLAISVKDAHPLIQEISHYVTVAKGGEHAVREVCELILTAKNIPLEH